MWTYFCKNDNTLEKLAFHQQDANNIFHSASIFSTGIIFLYFEIIISDGYSHHQVKLCRLYLPVWIIYQHISINGNLGMVFCRFIYVVYAQKLLAAGSRIFHFVLCVGIIVWTVQFW